MIKQLLAALLLCTAAGSAWAQTAPATGGDRPLPLGLRAGYTHWESISQLHLGAHAKLGDIFPNVQLTPGLEWGFGDDFTLVTLNGDLSYRFTELVSFPWELYGGGCLGLNYTKPADFDSDFQLGLSGLVGLAKKLAGGDEIMVETRFGLLDSPGFKLTLGYTFF